MSSVDPQDYSDAPQGQGDNPGVGETDGPFGRRSQSGAGEPQVVHSIIQSAPFEKYNMSHKKRGMAVIINNRTFQPQTGMGERKGSDVDAANLYKRFKALGFDVHLFHNQTAHKIFQIFHEASKVNHTDHDCFACAILSHGEEGLIWGVDDTVKAEDITDLFRADMCQSLAGKPKLFFIQACRGTKLDPGAIVFDSDDVEMPLDMEKKVAHRIPAMADFLIAYSAVPGFFSWRNSNKGSWFIQALVKILEQHGQMEELLHMMTRVNRMVAFEFESNAADPRMTNMKQVPSIVSQLTKDLYFTPK